MSVEGRGRISESGKRKMKCCYGRRHRSPVHEQNTIPLLYVIAPGMRTNPLYTSGYGLDELMLILLMW